MTDVCSYCGSDFVMTEAARRKSAFICLPCRTIRNRANYLSAKARGLRVSGPTSSPEHQREYRKDYEKRPETKAIRAAWRREAPKSSEHLQKVAARRMVRTAIEAGSLIRQPCEVCGETKVHGHHDDYSKPLAVRWLCQTHHWEHHRADGGGA